jgi:hypothetical protein
MTASFLYIDVASVLMTGSVLYIDDAVIGTEATSI